MPFDELAATVAVQLVGVFGNAYTYTRPDSSPFSLPAVIRKDVEMLDDYGQVVSRADTVRIAKTDIDAEGIEPRRGDTLSDGTTTWTVGKRMSFDGYAYVHEVVA